MVSLRLDNFLCRFTEVFFKVSIASLLINLKEPVELGNPNTCTEVNLCLLFYLFRLKK